MRRREFLTLPAKGFGGLVIYSLAGEPIRLEAQDGMVRVPLRFFTEAEAKAVAAACERIFPADENGPGASDANVIVYIDRQLAGPYGHDKYRYTKEPWIESVPEHGDQGKATPRDAYREGIPTLGADFAELPPEEQDARLLKIEDSAFFDLLRDHTLEGMFSDPLHGGNQQMVGWRLVGYPGPVMSYRYEIEEYHGKPYRREPKSLEQMVGHDVVGWEDEPV
ncbi:MAG: gluconate 2-dehydrogenase subunit 3 family protein [Bryobacterales bacterium]